MASASGQELHESEAFEIFGIELGIQKPLFEALRIPAQDDTNGPLSFGALVKFAEKLIAGFPKADQLEEQQLNDATKKLEQHGERLLKARSMLLDSEKKSISSSARAGSSRAASIRSIVPATGNRIAEAGATSTFGDADESDARVCARGAPSAELTVKRPRQEATTIAGGAAMDHVAAAAGASIALRPESHWPEQVQAFYPEIAQALMDARRNLDALLEIFRAAGVSTPEDDDAVAALAIEVRKGLDNLLTFLPEDALGEATPPIVGIVDAVASGLMKIGRAHV